MVPSLKSPNPAGATLLRARENPFRTERVLRVRYRFEDFTWSELLERCAVLNYRAALTGQHGSGKTTLLEDLEVRIRTQGFGTRFIRLDEEQPSFERGFTQQLFAELTSKDMLLFDGAEQLNPLSWLWFKRRARKLGGLIITTHRPGRLPTLLECKTTPQMLTAIAAELLGVPAETLRPTAEALFRKHGGNVREALRDWYDLKTRFPPTDKA